MKDIRPLPTWLFLFMIVCSVFFSTTMLRKQEISFSSDIARDFHLLREVDEKKLILIGPRSSVGGLFHGPLWTYLNYPAYKIGAGNPIAIGWWWMMLSCMFIGSCYAIIRALFTPLAGQLASIMIAVYMSYISQSFFNPHGAMFCIPFFFYTAVRYVQTRKASFLLWHMLTSGIIIQFQMAIGVPLFILSLVFHVYHILKFKTLNHLALFAIIIIPLSTFIIFDLRHDFLLLRNAIRHIQTGNTTITFLALVSDRFQNLITGIEFVRSGGAFWNTIVFCIFIFMIIMQLKSIKYGVIYKTFLFYFIGFYVLSLINKFPLLYFYTFPMFPLAFLLFASLVTSQFRNIFIGVYSIILVANFYGIKQHIAIQSAAMQIGGESWQTYLDVAKNLFSQNEETFGYFVYTPDTLAYPSKYALSYISSTSSKKALPFKKMPVTYLIIGPPPSDNPHMSENWWKENKLYLTKKPDNVISFKSRYRLEKYSLTPEEIATPFDPQIDPGIFFR